MFRLELCLDVQDSWNSVERTIDYYGDNQDVIIANAGPGQWNDPDMLIVGKRFGQTKIETRIT